MTSLEQKLVAGDQFSFSTSSLPGVNPDEEFGLAFGDWTGWHRNDYTGSARHNEPECLAKEEPLSPTSRVQAIGRYKEKMLELIGDAPEYIYELSLRDLMELPRIVELPRESPVRERLQKNKKAGRRHSRSESMESGGFLLKMLFPIPSSGRKRSSGSSSGRLKPGSRSSSSGSSDSGSGSSSTGTSKLGSSSSVTPKPLTKDGRKPGAAKSSEGKYVEMQQHGALSRNCNSSRDQNGCYSFFLNQNKSRTTKILCSEDSHCKIPLQPLY